jgi:hypothetical protein
VEGVFGGVQAGKVCGVGFAIDAELEIDEVRVRAGCRAVVGVFDAGCGFFGVVVCGEHFGHGGALVGAEHILVVRDPPGSVAGDVRRVRLELGREYLADGAGELGECGFLAGREGLQILSGQVGPGAVVRRELGPGGRDPNDRCRREVSLVGPVGGVAVQAPAELYCGGGVQVAAHAMRVLRSLCVEGGQQVPAGCRRFNVQLENELAAISPLPSSAV